MGVFKLADNSGIKNVSLEYDSISIKRSGSSIILTFIRYGNAICDINYNDLPIDFELKLNHLDGSLEVTMSEC